MFEKLAFLAGDTADLMCLINHCHCYNGTDIAGIVIEAQRKHNMLKMNDIKQYL